MLCGDFQSVWLLLRSGSQNKGINCRYSGQNFLLYLLFSYICPSQLCLLTLCSTPLNVLSIEWYFCLHSEISSSCFIPHSFIISLEIKKTLKTACSLLSFLPCDHLTMLPLLTLEWRTRLAFVSPLILLKKEVFASSLLIGDTNDSRFLASSLGSTDGTSHGWEEVELWGNETQHTFSWIWES